MACAPPAQHHDGRIGRVGTDIAGLHGTLHLNADGSYTYQSTANNIAATPRTCSSTRSRTVTATCRRRR
ncbi:VCBS domain-containing protein [Mesorhizobium sp. C432A]|uniref:VCBS domain-containing protein n=1 Tax=Mesorhizobium sp. C432A TaxID=2956836 RepID=UPI0025772188|nr:VCBS domain-containing protein [Mesorhizobium sp. C432A]WJI57199.1 VCBS domain-containing protein [Mesorhizobium sp. C432A]